MSAERIAALEAELARAQATIRDQARALAEHAEREAAERRRKEARAAVNRQNYERRKTGVRPVSDQIQRLNETVPSFSSPPLDGPPLSSPDPISPLPFIPSPPLPPSLSGSEPRPPVSDNSADVHPEDEAAVERLGPASKHPEHMYLSPDGPEMARRRQESLERQAAVEAARPNHPAIPESSPQPAAGMPARTPGTARQASNGATPLPQVLELALLPEKRAPAAKAARKVADGEKPPDPRHKPLVDALCAAFLEATGAAYAFSGRSAKTVTALLLQADCAPDTRGPAAHDAVLQRWRWGMGWEIPLSRRRPVQTLEQLLQHWNELAQEPPKPEAPRNPNAPTQATEWDWTSTLPKETANG